MFFQDVIYFTAEFRKTTSVVFIGHYCTIIRFSAMKVYLKVFSFQISCQQMEI